MDHGPDDPVRATNLASGHVAGRLTQIGTVHGGVHLHSPPRPVVTLPHRTVSIPQHATALQPRSATDELARILGHGDTAILTSNSAVRAGVISGLGGVGKTQIALAYAEQAWATGMLDLLVWVTASSRDAIVSAYAELATELDGHTDPDPDRGARRLLSWLATAKARWLIVLDDLQQPHDLDGLWPPTMETGRVVVTTRRRDAALRGPCRRQIGIGLFTSREAHNYLRDALADQPLLLDNMTELASSLGYLPLALAQAVAYMIDRDLSCTLFPDTDGLPDQQRATIATTWSLSIEHANQLEPAGLARPMLDVASMLDANGIPTDVFATSAVTGLLATLTEREIDAAEAHDALGCLHRLTLITRSQDSATHAVRVHALVQRATREAMPDAYRTRIAHAAADALLEIWPDIEADPQIGQVLRANTATLAEHSGPHLWTPDAHTVLLRAGKSLGDAGLATKARTYFTQLRSVAEQQLGHSHPSTLTIRHGLARWQGEAGDPATAAAEFHRVLEDRIRVLGPDHPDTLRTRSSLADWRARTGDPAGAAEEYERILDNQLRVLGRDHPDTSTTRNNLAYWRGEVGNPTAAAADFERLFDERLRTLGPDHPKTLRTLNNLAYWLAASGDPAGAAAALDRLADRQDLNGR
ncbi:tetratricopeptide repeat protein [Amycolatopsis sp. DG1A-15b]|uniref:tetratricopeptide repeat protein n=1 Tax=Amycolatopsis sp. DG1A-15b TaxID=3052846 RepID=UPI00255B4EAA|nr:tetratricopeptide repeat protein [Amycolatopsis sp. DG1A-15b]WIX92785.1 tetratricopeptide repeat protein [Amycolatopsis sp. DG1A-15b]